jgi:uncharacterized protein YraI
VRAEPSTTGDVLGLIPASTKVQIIGTDPGGNWWQILYPAGSEGKGWVTAKYVTTVSKPQVPVIGGGEANPNAGNSAVVIQQLNVRNGPGTSFDSVGILNANDVVTLTGKNSNGSWLQIAFDKALNGNGWVNAAFLKANDLGSLPIVADSGAVVGTGTPENTPLPPTPTIVPAPLDKDSAEQPIKTVIFDRGGTNTLLYNGDVSTPDGDTEDWISVTPYGENLYVSIECVGNGTARALMIGSDVKVECNQPMRLVPAEAGLPFLIEIQAVPASDALQYVRYNLTIKASP